MMLMVLSGPKTVMSGWSSLPCCLIVHLTEYSSKLVPHLHLNITTWLDLSRSEMNIGLPRHVFDHLPLMIHSVSTCRSCLIQPIMARNSLRIEGMVLHGSLLVFLEPARVSRIAIISLDLLCSPAACPHARRLCRLFAYSYGGLHGLCWISSMI